MGLSQLTKLLLIAGFIGGACGVRFIDSDRLSIESVAKSICDLEKGTDIQIGRAGTVGTLLSYLTDLPPRHKLSNCRNKYLDSIKELNNLVSGREDVCSDGHLKKIEEFHKAYVSKISKHVKHRKANKLAAPWLLVMFFMHYASASSKFCEARAVEIMSQGETDVQSSKDMMDVEQLLKQFTETIGMKTELTQWNKDVFLIWSLVDNLPLESSKKFRKYLANGDERLFIRTQEAEQLISLQTFCIKQKPEYENDLLPLIRLADLGYFRAGESKLNTISSMKRHYMMIQMCETLLPIRVMENDGPLKPGQIVLVPVEEVKQVSPRKTFPQSRPVPRTESPFKLIIDQVTADVEVNTLMETVKYREKTMKRLVKNMAKNVARKMKSKAGQLLVRNGKNNEDYESMVESSLAEIEEDDSDWSELEDSPYPNNGLIRTRRGVKGFFKAWVDLAFNIIDGIAFTIGIVFLFAVKVALVFIVFIYKLGRSLTGVGYKPLEHMFDYVWNAGFRITRKELNLADHKNKFDFDKHKRHHHHGDYKHSKYDAEYDHYPHGSHKDHHHHHKHHGDHRHSKYDVKHYDPHFDHERLSSRYDHDLHHHEHFDHDYDHHVHQHHHHEPHFEHPFDHRGPFDARSPFGPPPPHYPSTFYPLPPPNLHHYPERF